MERTDSGGRPPVRGWSPGPALAAFHDGVTVICQLSAQFADAGWLAPSPCPEWRVVDLAGHLRCVADDYPRVPRRRPGQPAGPADGHRGASGHAGPQAGPAERRGTRRPPRRVRAGAHRGVRQLGPVVRAAPPADLGSAASPVPGGAGHGRRDGGRRLRGVASARLGSRPGRWARTTVPPTRTSCSAAGTRGCRTCWPGRGLEHSGAEEAATAVAAGAAARLAGAGGPRGPVACHAPRIRQDSAGQDFSRSGAVASRGGLRRPAGPGPGSRRQAGPG